MCGGSLSHFGGRYVDDGETLTCEPSMENVKLISLVLAYDLLHRSLLFFGIFVMLRSSYKRILAAG